MNEIDMDAPLYRGIRIYLLAQRHLRESEQSIIH